MFCSRRRNYVIGDEGGEEYTFPSRQLPHHVLWRSSFRIRFFGDSLCISPSVANSSTVAAAPRARRPVMANPSEVDPNEVEPAAGVLELEDDDDDDMEDDDEFLDSEEEEWSEEEISEDDDSSDEDWPITQYEYDWDDDEMRPEFPLILNADTNIPLPPPPIVQPSAFLIPDPPPIVEPSAFSFPDPPPIVEPSVPSCPDPPLNVD